MDKIDLFCYGTLQSPMVMKAVTGQSFSGAKATLENWMRFRVRQSAYPGILPQENGQVPGTVFTALDAETLAKLDDFEGDKYERVQVTVTLEDGSKKEVQVYAIRRECRHLLSQDSWDFDRFLENGLARFITWFVEDRRDLSDRGDF
ncbi:MAG: gamma-glutamylcyclotransferase [Desulfobulbaceae bacterium]|nr:gamma-glutamylcyclotransferase [Desulfobulbaceae bacterium]